MNGSVNRHFEMSYRTRNDTHSSPCSASSCSSVRHRSHRTSSILHKALLPNKHTLIYRCPTNSEDSIFCLLDTQKGAEGACLLVARLFSWSYCSLIAVYSLC